MLFLIARFSALSILRNKADVTETQSGFDRATDRAQKKRKKKSGPEPFRVEFECSPCVSVSSLQVLQLPSTVLKHPSEVNWKLFWPCSEVRLVSTNVANYLPLHLSPVGTHWLLDYGQIV